MFQAFVERMPWSWVPAPGLVTKVGSRLATEVAVVAEWLRRAQCGVLGHGMILNLEQRRMSLRCLHCGHETPGWTIDAHR
jgi:hypothetical protein